MKKPKYLEGSWKRTSNPIRLGIGLIIIAVSLPFVVVASCAATIAVMLAGAAKWIAMNETEN